MNMSNTLDMYAGSWIRLRVERSECPSGGEFWKWDWSKKCCWLCITRFSFGITH